MMQQQQQAIMQQQQQQQAMMQQQQQQQQALQQQQMRSGAPGPPMGMSMQPPAPQLQRPPQQQLPGGGVRLPQPGMMPPGAAPGAPGLQRPPLVNPQQAAMLTAAAAAGAPGPAQLMAMRAAQGFAAGGAAAGAGGLAEIYSGQVVNAEQVVAARLPVQRRLLPSGAVTTAPPDEAGKILPRSQLERLMRMHGLDQARSAEGERGKGQGEGALPRRRSGVCERCLLSPAGPCPPRCLVQPCALRPPTERPPPAPSELSAH
jgi:hypothetical protein